MIESINALNNVLITTYNRTLEHGNFKAYHVRSSLFARERIIEILEENNQEYVIFNGEVRFTQRS